jgi:hypothetical protein
MAPKFRVQAHVLYFSSICGIGTLVALGVAKAFGKSDVEKEAILRRKFPDRTRQNEQQRMEMQKFFDQMKVGPDQHDDKFDGILKGGKGYNRGYERFNRNSEAVKAHMNEKKKDLDVKGK